MARLGLKTASIKGQIPHLEFLLTRVIVRKTHSTVELTNIVRLNFTSSPLAEVDRERLALDRANNNGRIVMLNFEDVRVTYRIKEHLLEFAIAIIISIGRHQNGRMVTRNRSVAGKWSLCRRLWYDIVREASEAMYRDRP